MLKIYNDKKLNFGELLIEDNSVTTPQKHPNVYSTNLWIKGHHKKQMKSSSWEKLMIIISDIHLNLLY